MQCFKIVTNHEAVTCQNKAYNANRVVHRLVAGSQLVIHSGSLPSVGR